MFGPGGEIRIIGHRGARGVAPENTVPAIRHGVDVGDDMGRFRVWDYPINEQYKSILKNIRKTGTVGSVQEGFDKLMSEEAESLAFIHDEAQVRREYMAVHIQDFLCAFKASAAPSPRLRGRKLALGLR